MLVALKPLRVGDQTISPGEAVPMIDDRCWDGPIARGEVALVADSEPEKAARKSRGSKAKADSEPEKAARSDD